MKLSKKKVHAGIRSRGIQWINGAPSENVCESIYSLSLYANCMRYTRYMIVIDDGRTRVK